MAASRSERVLAGLEAGVLGGLLMLVALIVLSLAEGDPWWNFPNLLGSTFYNGRILRSGVGWPTVVGVAFQILTTGIVGAIFGWLFVGSFGVPRLALLGTVTGLVWFYLSNLLYRTINPWMAAASLDSGVIVAHALFGACLGGAGRRFRPARRVGVVVEGSGFALLPTPPFTQPPPLAESPGLLRDDNTSTPEPTPENHTVAGQSTPLEQGSEKAPRHPSDI